MFDTNIVCITCEQTIKVTPSELPPTNMVEYLAKAARKKIEKNITNFSVLKFFTNINNKLIIKLAR
jgi:hypothetical protein